MRGARGAVAALLAGGALGPAARRGTTFPGGFRGPRGVLHVRR